MRWIFLLLLIKTALAASTKGGGAMMNMAVLTDLHADCDQDGMTVSVEFSQPFNGIIYSKGYYSDPSCRYVQAGSGSRVHSFHIASSHCGSIFNYEDDKSVQNTLIFQMDPSVQEVWDTAKKISCSWSPNVKKRVQFEPLSVSMLEVVSANFGGDQVKCWMEIKKGIYPDVDDLEGIVAIGDPLSLMVYVQDDENAVDLGVRDCWAFGSDSFDSKTSARVQLTSENGCTIKSKLMDRWRREKTIMDGREAVLAYTNISAFKFPDHSQIFLTCNVEICFGRCNDLCSGVPPEDPYIPSKPSERIKITTSFPPPPSQPRLPPKSPFRPTPSSPQPFKFSPKPPPRPAPKDTPLPPRPAPKDTPLPPRTAPKNTPLPSPPPTPFPPFPPSTIPELSYLPPIPSETDDSPPHSPTLPSIPVPSPFPDFPPSVTTLSPNSPLFPTPEECFPGSPNPRCKGIPPKCYPGSNDPSCKDVPNSPSFESKCYEGDSDPKCKVHFKPICYPGSPDPRCVKPTPPICYPGSQDPRCRQQLPTPKPQDFSFSCSENPEDPRCSSVEITKQECLPGTYGPLCLKPKQVEILKCKPGSTDPYCQNSIKPPKTKPSSFTKEYSCTPFSKDPRCSTKPGRPKSILTCLVEPNRPNCIPPQQNSAEIRIEKTTQPPVIVPTTFRCYPGSRDRRCKRPTTTRITQKPKIDYPTRRPFIEQPPLQNIVCQPGSKHPRCKVPKIPVTATTTETSSEECLPGTRNCRDRVKPIVEIKTDRCTPGSNDDPNCARQKVPYKPLITSVTPKPTPKCIKGTKDPRCWPTPPPHLPGISVGVEIPTIKPFTCLPGSSHPRCKTNRITEKPFVCLPNSQDPRCPRPVKPSQSITNFFCVPGSKDPRCVQSIETIELLDSEELICHPNTNDPRCKRPTTTRPICLPGSRDPYCIDSKQSQNEEFICTGLSSDPRCHFVNKFVCSPNSKDPRCRSPVIPETSEESLIINCRPDSTDPRCPRPTPPQPLRPTKLKCLPGSNDPRCPRPTSTSKVICRPGSKDPKCLKDTTTPFPATDSTLFGEKTFLPTPTPAIPRRKPSKKKGKMLSKDMDDFHGDKSPRYHAFHRYLYEPLPRPRSQNRLRTKRGTKYVPMTQHTAENNTQITKKEESLSISVPEGSFKVFKGVNIEEIPLKSIHIDFNYGIESQQQEYLVPGQAEPSRFINSLAIVLLSISAVLFGIALAVYLSYPNRGVFSKVYKKRTIRTGRSERY